MMNNINYIPDKYHDLHVVNDMNGILTPAFNRQLEHDVLILPRTLQGDYDGLSLEISSYIDLPKDDCDEFTLETFTDILPNLALSKKQETAAEEIISDLRQSESHNPYLFIEGPSFGAEEGFSQWHYDDANEDDDMTSRILCSYNRSPTQFLRRDDAIYVGAHHFQQRQGSQTWSAQRHDITRHRLCSEFDVSGSPIATAHKRPKTTHTLVPGLLLNA